MRSLQVLACIYVCLIRLTINAAKTARGGAYDDEDYELLHRSSYKRISAPKVGRTITELRNKGIIPSENQMLANKDNLETLPGYNLYLGMSAAVESFKQRVDKCSCCAFTVIDPDHYAKVIMEATKPLENEDKAIEEECLYCKYVPFMEYVSKYVPFMENDKICEEFNLYELHFFGGHWKLKRMENKYDPTTSRFRRWRGDVKKWWDEFEEATDLRRKAEEHAQQQRRAQEEQRRAQEQAQHRPQKQEKGFWGGLWETVWTIAVTSVAAIVDLFIFVPLLGAPVATPLAVAAAIGYEYQNTINLLTF